MSDTDTPQEDTFLRRLATGGLIAIGGPLHGVKFGPSSRRVKAGTGELYELREEDTPPPYEEPTTSPEKPMVVTQAELDEYERQSAEIEAAKQRGETPAPALNVPIVVDHLGGVDLVAPEVAVTPEVVEEAPAVEEVVEEAPAVEEVVEEAPAVEEVVEEAPAVEEVVEEAPAVEPVAPKGRTRKRK